MHGTMNVKKNYSALFWKGESGVMEDSATADWSQHRRIKLLATHENNSDLDSGGAGRS